MSLKQYLFNEDKDSIKKSIHKVVSLKIKESVGVKLDDFSIQNINITKFNRLHIKILYDERHIQEKKENNYSGVNVTRKVKETDVIKFGYIRNDYKFSQDAITKKFRVENSDQTHICNRCDGSKAILCFECRGGGKLRCDECSGKGEKTCTNCGGRGDTRCFWCSGKGHKTTGFGENEKRERCNSCSGTGRQKCNSCTNGHVRCTRCYGTGQVTCYLCKGQGNLPCNNCDATGSFIHYLSVKSTLYSLENIMYLDGLPKNEVFVKNLLSEEHKYSKYFTDIYLKKLSKYKSEFKDLHENQKIKDNQRAELVLFTLQECVSLTFTIKIGNSSYDGCLKDGKIWFDQSIINFLFYDIIDGLDLNQNFKSLDPIKKALLNKVPEFNSTWLKINEFNKLHAIITSKVKIDTKILATRQLKKIDNGLYLNKLYKLFVNKFVTIVKITLLIIAFIPIIAVFINNGFEMQLRNLDTNYLQVYLLFVSQLTLSFVFVKVWLTKRIKKSSPSFTGTISIIILVVGIFISVITVYNFHKSLQEKKTVAHDFTIYKSKNKLALISITELVRFNHDGGLASIKEVIHKVDTIIILGLTNKIKEFKYLSIGKPYFSYDSYIYNDNGQWEPQGNYRKRISNRIISIRLNDKIYNNSQKGDKVKAKEFLGSPIEIMFEDIEFDDEATEVQIKFMRNSINDYKQKMIYIVFIKKSVYNKIISNDEIVKIDNTFNIETFLD